jgi:MFS family permease
MLFFGSMFGFLVIPYIADNAGRKISLEIAWGIAIGGVVIILIADSSNMIGLGLFFIGFGTNPATTLSFSFINEQCLGKYRQRFNIGVLVSFSLGEISIGLIFSLGLSWRTIMLLFLFICLAVLALIFKFILESHMFLVKKNPS